MAEFKFFCPQCGQHIQCDTSYSGRQINCPVCQQAIVVPQPPRADGATPVPAKPQTLRKVLVIAALVVAFAGLIVIGWYGYSKIRIYVKSGHLPSGVVALWSGDGNGKDSIGGNNAVLTDISFAKGKVGRAFRFNGKNSSVKIPASQSLDVGAGGGFTIMAWIKLADISEAHPIFEWNDDGNALGVHFYSYPSGQLLANVVDTSGNYSVVTTGFNVVTANAFQYVALTYEKASGVATIYCNGVVAAQDHIGGIFPQTSYSLYLGRRPLIHGQTLAFVGMLDEPSVYNRALSASEIQAIYEKQK